MTRDNSEWKKRAEAYSKAHTFTFIKETTPNGRENFYNGFVVKVYNDMLIFFDIILKKEFPILFESIEVIEPSRKDVEIKTAFEIYKEEKKWTKS